jgi:hypothetical protein
MDKKGQSLANLALVFMIISSILTVVVAFFFKEGLPDVLNYNPDGNESYNSLGVAFVLVFLFGAAGIEALVLIPSLIMSTIATVQKNKKGLVVLIIDIALLVITLSLVLGFYLFAKSKGVIS